MPAPSAARIASSPSRRIVRARIKLATFEQAMTNTSSDAAINTNNTVRAFDVIWSRRPMASMRKSALRRVGFGMLLDHRRREPRAVPHAPVRSVAPGASRAEQFSHAMHAAL